MQQQRSVPDADDEGRDQFPGLSNAGSNGGSAPSQEVADKSAANAASPDCIKCQRWDDQIPVQLASEQAPQIT